MKVSNVRVYGLEESIIAGGYPMLSKTLTEDEFEAEVNFIKDVNSGRAEETVGSKQHMRRTNSLSNTPQGQGHDQVLTGIHIDFDLDCTNKMWVEMERYRFVFFVSSYSTMHRMAAFDLDGMYNEYVDPIIIKRVKELQEVYLETGNKEDYLNLLYSNPAGFNLTARLTTNYRSLKTIYGQRRKHRLPEWREFCVWIETLPMSYLITGKE